MRRLLCTTALLAALPLAAHADLILSITDDNTAGFAAGPYATVDVQRTSSTQATVTFTRVGQFTFGEMGLNVNAASFTAGTVSFVKAATDTNTPTYTATFNGQLDGFGNFRLDDVANPAGFSASVTSATFTLTNTSGTWATDASVLTPNNPQGKEAAIHVFDSLANGNSSFASDGPTVVTHGVPEPGTLALLGTGLLGLGMLRRRR